MIVKKFGGTSVKDADAISNVADIILKDRDSNPLVVLSACAGVTNQLIAIAGDAEQRSTAKAQDSAAGLLARHLRISAELLEGEARQEADKTLRRIFAKLEELIAGVSALQEATARTLDQFLCLGELCSSLLLYHTLRQRGAAASLVDARKVLITDGEFGKARPLFKWTKRGARLHLLPALKRGETVITQGFIGATQDGTTTTLGRGGSDYSAAILGSVLDAEEIEIWTDVEGILTADPSLLKEARPIPEMSFSEASELAYFGARVLHPSTLLPAIRKDIPVRVLNSACPERPGTIIRSRAPASCGAVKSIAYKEGITLIRIQSSRMLMGNGFLGDLLQVFARHKKGVDLVATSMVGASITIRDSTGLLELVRELELMGEVTVERNKAICCVVGEGMKAAHGIAAKVFGALESSQVPVEMISHGGSDINLTVLIDERHIAAAVASLHARFFPERWRARTAREDRVVES